MEASYWLTTCTTYLCYFLTKGMCTSQQLLKTDAPVVLFYYFFQPLFQIPLSSVTGGQVFVQQANEESTDGQENTS